MKRISLALVIDGTKLQVLDQTRLPHDETWIQIDSVDRMVTAIQSLSVRGAPLIGIAAVMTVAREALLQKSSEQILHAIQSLRTSRPTAVNLMNCLDRLKHIFVASQYNPKELIEGAFQLFDEDVAMCERMAANAQKYIQDGDRILTHCNTGGLATVGIGTALGAIKAAHRLGKRLHIYVDETRPLLQGARLTTWELQKAQIPFTLITDNMAAAAFQAGVIDKVFLGADRITANGDVANKIGTYGVAILAKFHAKPLYVVAPRTTLDPDLQTGAEITIEQRHGSEILGQLPEIFPTWNPSFDVTPRALISDIITDQI
jgi:methylthioribose-1-phosphate isomerase